jgi:hypothetical protein
MIAFKKLLTLHADVSPCVCPFPDIATTQSTITIALLRHLALLTENAE